MKESIKPGSDLNQLSFISKEPELAFLNPGVCERDFFSEIFFHLSRWEEYGVNDVDHYGRFKAENAFLYKAGLLDLPVVEIWAQKLMDELRKVSPHLPGMKRCYRYIPSVDIDNAFAFKHKSLTRTAASTAKDLLHFRLRNCTRRLNVLIKGKRDPYDTYAQLDSAHARCKERPIYFFLLADEGKYDRNLPYTNPAIRDLVKTTQKQYHVGIHPGMSSNQSLHTLEAEKKRLEQLTGQACTKSRQHYLYLRFPETYQRLINAGIQEDYSMGYASQVGFRAGTCLPFRFYDLEKEAVTELTVVPFAFMDATLHLYLGLNEQASLEKVQGLVNEIRRVNGLCMSLWHNETLGGMWHWEQWEQVYSKIVSICES
jgi:hypothetical protein